MKLKGFTRAGLLTAGWATGLTSLLWACGQPDFYLSAPMSAARSAQNAYQELSQKYGPIIRPLRANETNLPWWFVLGITYEPAAYESTPDPSYLDPSLLDQELAKYPKPFFRNAPVDSILWAREFKGSILLGGLDFAGMGFALFNQRRVFIESRHEFRFYALHHEIFHAVDDFALFGNPDFTRCNPVGFHYQSGARGWGDYPQKGFVSSYALSQVSEDQAEVAAMMIASPQSAQLLESWIANGDTVLACKRDAIKNYLKARFAGFNSRRFDLLALGLTSAQLETAMQDPARIESLVPPVTEWFQFERQQSDSVKAIPFKMSAAIGLLTGLKQIDIYRYPFTELPAELGQLKQLESLKLDWAPFKTLPDVLRQLSSLKNLSLALVRLQSASPLPQQLNTLSLGFSSIASAELEAFLSAQAQLKELHLWLDEQSGLPLAIQKMQNLQALSIYGPKLLTLPDWLPQLKALRQLKLTALHTALHSAGPKDFPVEPISQLKQLEQLEISDSHLNTLPDLSQFKQLQTLVLERNNLTELPLELLDLPALKTIRVDQNPLDPGKIQAFKARAEAKGMTVQCFSVTGCF